MLRTVTATRYVTPLREGGSLPAIVEADDDGLYVLKFRGAGQGPKALAAEIVAGELARDLGLPVPELVLIEVDPALGAAEPDPEIQELINASAGINLGVDFLPGSLPYDPTDPPDADLAADVVWLDALITNVDRTPRNPNLLRWHRNLWLIDHGASLYAFHGPDPLARARGAFPAIRDHVLLPAASSIAAADERLAGQGRPGARGVARPGRSGPTAQPYGEFLAAAAAGAAGVGERPSVSAPDRPQRAPFQYAALRVVPRVERGEAVNAGVVLFCRPLRFLGAKTQLDEGLLKALAPDCDPVAVADAAADDGADRGGGPERRADRPAAAVRALPLAGRAREHDRAARAGPHRPDERSERGTRESFRATRGTLSQSRPYSRCDP